MKTNTWAAVVLIIGGLRAASAVQAATVPVYWDPVTTNTDASAITDLSGYRVFWATYTLTGMTTGQAMLSASVSKQAVAQPAVTFTLPSLADGTTYFIRMAATNNGGMQSNWSVQGDLVSDLELSTCTPPAPTPPAAPGAPVLSVLSDTQVNVSWADNSAAPNAETGFRVERSFDGVTYSTVTTTAANATSYPDGGLSPSTQYFYRIVAKNAVGEASSGAASATTNAAPTSPPPAPGSPSPVAVSSFSVSLSWGDVAGENSYQVQRSASQTTGFATVGTSLPNVTTFLNNSGLSSGTTYFYRIVAVNGVGASTSTVVSARTIPAAPGAQAPVAVSTGQIDVSWTNVTGEDGFRIERSLSQGSGFAQIASVGLNVTAYSDAAGLSAGTSYYYRVRAYNATGNSGYTAVMTGKTMSPAVLPGGFGSVPPGLKEAYCYPNPAVGVDPVLRGFMGGVDQMEVTIYDAAGRVVQSGRTTTQVMVKGEPALEYRWVGERIPGVYYAVMHGKKDGQTIRARTKFAVVR